MNMKLASTPILALFLSASPAFATARIDCAVVDASRPPSWPADRMLFTTEAATADADRVATIESVTFVPESGGVFAREVELLYSRTYQEPSIRGGLRISYCNPDESTVSHATGRLRVESQCTMPGGAGNLTFRASQTPDGRGAVSIFIPNETGDVKRDFTLKDCR